MFLTIPENHREFIFHLLDPKDLFVLGQVNKKLYQNQNRKNILIRKVVDQFFYRSKDLPCPIKNWELFQRFDTQNQFDSYYLDKLVHLDFKRDILVIENPETSHVKKLKVQTHPFNTHSHFYYLTSDYHHLNLSIIFLLEKIMGHATDQKHRIIDRVVKFMKDLIQFASDKSQIITVSFLGKYYFDFYHLYECLHKFLAILFQKDPVVRQSILNQLLELHTEDGEYNFFKPRCQYRIESFIELCDFHYKDLKHFLQIAELFVDYSSFLCYLFYFHFNILFNLNYDEDLIEYDEIAYDIEKQLSCTVFKERFYDLVCIFDPKGSFILNLNHSIEFRRMRLENGQYEEEIEEDYDY